MLRSAGACRASERPEEGKPQNGILPPSWKLHRIRVARVPHDLEIRPEPDCRVQEPLATEDPHRERRSTAQQQVVDVFRVGKPSLDAAAIARDEIRAEKKVRFLRKGIPDNESRPD